MITIVVGMGGVPSVQYRDPDLGEVIEFLSNPCSVIQVNILINVFSCHRREKIENFVNFLICFLFIVKKAEEIFLVIILQANFLLFV